ncbi:MAG: hypothetical protein IT463_02125, partial [Planctomycetes bacterium]|nr:hypothetical protein [Planctomycetota bacterium]
PHERQELLGGLRELPRRLPAALLAALLLWLASDTAGFWPLAWVAFFPLAAAQRGVGPVAALVLALCALLPPAVGLGFWLGADARVWGAACAPVLAVAALELPVVARRSRWLRGPLLALLLTGAWAQLVPHGEALIPLGGLIDSGVIRLVYPKLGLATVAALMATLAWAAANLGAAGRRPGLPTQRKALVGAAVLACIAFVDWLDLRSRPPLSGDMAATVLGVPGGMPAAAELPSSRGTVFLGCIAVPGDDSAAALLGECRELATRRSCTVAVLMALPGETRGYLLVRGDGESSRTWQGAPGEALGEPLIVEGPGNLMLFPDLRMARNHSSHLDLQLCATLAVPRHDAEVRFRVREQRRAALIRGTRQVALWPGGGVAVDSRGDVVASSQGGEAVSVVLPFGDARGEAMARARFTVYETILRWAAPALWVMLLLVSVVNLAKRRYLARQATSGARTGSDSTPSAQS